MALRSKEYLFDIPESDDNDQILYRNGKVYLANQETKEFIELGDIQVDKSLDDRKTPLRPGQFNWAVDGLKEWGISEHFVEIQKNEVVCNSCYIIINKYRECDCK
jgi:hypothetical protein